MRCLATTLHIVDCCHVPPNALISVRLKRLDSIQRKLKRPCTNFTLGRLNDVIGVRVICHNLQAVRDFGARIKQSPEFQSMKDYVTAPRTTTGYRALHGILTLHQPAGAGVELNVRFEIQVRSYLQHCWAVWSESHGDAVKIGAGNSAEHAHLRQLSQKIANWEEANAAVTQHNLPQYRNGHSLTVCWRPPHGPAMLLCFQEDVQAAVKWLNYLEETHMERRRAALLLVGVSEHSNAERLIRTTHPLYAGVRVLDPEYWMPEGSLS